MLSQLERFDAVIYWKMDRLGRRTMQSWEVAEACWQSNTRLVSVLDPVGASSVPHRPRCRWRGGLRRLLRVGERWLRSAAW